VVTGDEEFDSVLNDYVENSIFYNMKIRGTEEKTGKRRRKMPF
jgi:hypothetical protein